MNSARSRSGQKTRAIASPFLAILLTFLLGCLFGGVAHGASKSQGPEVDTESGYTDQFEGMPGAAAQASQQISQGRTISEEEAREIALKAVPGEVMDVAIEKKLGAKRFVVEVIADADGAESDVIIDMETGKVLATEK